MRAGEEVDPRRARSAQEQHHQLRALFEQLDDAAPEYRRSLVDELAGLLVAHAAIEKEIFYPALAERAEAAVLAAVEELAMIGQCLDKLLEIGTTDRTFAAKVSVLEDMVRRHVELAERDIFSLAQRRPAEALVALGARMAERFREMRAAGPPRPLSGADPGIVHADPASAIPPEHEVRSAARSGIRPTAFGRQRQSG